MPYIRAVIFWDLVSFLEFVKLFFFFLFHRIGDDVRGVKGLGIRVYSRLLVAGCGFYLEEEFGIGAC